MARVLEWTAHQIRLLRAGWAEGLSTRLIGYTIMPGYDIKNAVIGKAKRLGLPHRPSPIRPVYGPPPPRKRRHVRRAPKPTVDNPMPTLQAIAPPPPREIAPPPRARPVAPVQPVVEKEVYAPVVPCRWPLGEPKTRGFRFCEVPSVAGKSYCNEHCLVAYVTPLQARRQEARVEREVERLTRNTALAEVL